MRDEWLRFPAGDRDQVAAMVRVAAEWETDMKRSESPVQTQKVGEGPETMRIYLPGLAERVHLALERAGYDAVSLCQASQEDLEAVDGIGPATARKIRKILDACTPV